MHVLVADDCSDTREIMRLLLELRGHEVSVAANGEEAVECAVSQHPDVVLMDLNMPVMDGLDAARTLRAAPDTARIPIVALSAHITDASWRARALECGCDACFTKPLDFEALETLLSSCEHAGRA